MVIATQRDDDPPHQADLLAARCYRVHVFVQAAAIGVQRRRSHAGSRGTSAVEFALVGPTAFLLLMGAVILGLVITNEIELTQAVRDGARAAAICGSTTDQGTGSTLPNGTLCTTANINAYINTYVDAVSPSLSNQAVITVVDANGASLGTSLSECLRDYNSVQVSITYQQPLFVPLVGAVLGNASTNTRTIVAQGEATCEQ